jgi:glyoxylase I family protein
LIFAFQVDDVDEKLAEIGFDAEVTLGPLAFDNFIPGWKTAWVRDPDGNIVEISQGFVDQERPPAADFELATAEAIGQ